MLSLAPGYARLDVRKDEDFGHVSESIRTLLYVCRINSLRGALIVSAQDGFDWRSSLRIGLHFAAARSAVDGIRLALVAGHFNDGARDDVLEAARSVGMECRVFRREDDALVWLASAAAGSGRAVPGPAAPRQ